MRALRTEVQSELAHRLDMQTLQLGALVAGILATAAGFAAVF